MDTSPSTQQENLDVVARVGPLIANGFVGDDIDLFADDLVFHFFNPSLPDLAGDHRGLDGMRGLFDGYIHEAWDIPAINTVRPHRAATG